MDAMNAMAPLWRTLDLGRWMLVQHGGALRRRLGVAGAAAIAGAVVAAAFVAIDVRLQHELRDVTGSLAALDRAQRFGADPADMPLAPADDDAARVRERLHVFDDGLPAFDDAGESLNDILRIAEKHNLKIVHGEYHATSDEGADFARYEMSLPVSGDPSAVQALLAETLRAQRFLAVEHLRVQRSAQTPGTVEAQVRWVLFVRKPVAADPAVGVASAASARTGMK